PMVANRAGLRQDSTLETQTPGLELLLVMLYGPDTGLPPLESSSCVLVGLAGTTWLPSINTRIPTVVPSSVLTLTRHVYQVLGQIFTDDGQRPEPWSGVCTPALYRFNEPVPGTMAVLMLNS